MVRVVLGMFLWAWVKGVKGRRNLLFLRVVRPDPSILILYWSCPIIFTTVSDLSHFLA